MRIKDELFGKEVLDAEIQIVGKVTDVVFDKDSFEKRAFAWRKRKTVERNLDILKS